MVPTSAGQTSLSHGEFPDAHFAAKGAGNATPYLLAQMAEVPGIEIELVTSSLDRERVERFASNITIHFLDIGKKGTGVHFQTNANLLRYAWAARLDAGRLMRQKPFELIHAFFSIPSGWIARGLGLPYVVSLRGSDVPFYNPRFYWLDRLVFRRLNRSIWHDASRVIANSRGLRDLALRTAPGQEIPVIPNGVDTDCFRPADAAPQDAERPFTVISTSRLIQRKGIGHLVEAFARFHSGHENSLLLLAGTGDLETPLREQVEAAGLSVAVRFHGRVLHAELPELDLALNGRLGGFRATFEGGGSVSEKLLLPAIEDGRLQVVLAA